MQSAKTSIKTQKFMSLILHFMTRVTTVFQKVKTEELKISIHYKDENEKFTEGDWIIQKMFENYMFKYFPTINIIGEEDTSDNLIKQSEFFVIEEEEDIDFSIIKDDDIPEMIKELNSEDLCVYIDPIDATEAFIKKKFEPVTCLVGLTLKTGAFIGFVHFPFYLGKEDNSFTFFNIPSKGIFSYNSKTKEIKSVSYVKKELNQIDFISSTTKTNDKMREVFALFKNSTTKQASGLGNKAFICALEDVIYLANGGSKIRN